ncbi:MAG TPA: hypothetical protein VEK56_18710 [Vicinamibacterales bacterium]|nr:hypothetical protein [Vicinamibacterales bacterium]
MFTLFMLATLAFVGMSVVAVLGFVFFVLRLALWAVFFPIRLLLKLLWIPIGLTFGAVGLALGATALPLLALFAGGILIFGLVAAAVALLLPAIPFVLFGLLLWAIFRRHPATT